MTCFMWSGVLEIPSLLSSCSITTTSLHITTQHTNNTLSLHILTSVYICLHLSTSLFQLLQVQGLIGIGSQIGPHGHGADPISGVLNPIPPLTDNASIGQATANTRQPSTARLAKQRMERDGDGNAVDSDLDQLITMAPRIKGMGTNSKVSHNSHKPNSHSHGSHSPTRVSIAPAGLSEPMESSEDQSTSTNKKEEKEAKPDWGAKKIFDVDDSYNFGDFEVRTYE